jgi:hypothetical protein
MSAGKLPAGMLAVATPVVGDVQIRRHQLDLEAGSLVRMCARIRKRLNRWLREMPEEIAAMRDMGRVDDKGKPILEPVCGPDGKPLLEPFLPGEDWRELFRWYQTATLGMLKEQRERAKLQAGKHKLPVDDATFDAQLHELARMAVLEMPKAELEALIRARAIDVAVPDASPITDTEDPRLKL